MTWACANGFTYPALLGVDVQPELASDERGLLAALVSVGVGDDAGGVCVGGGAGAVVRAGIRAVGVDWLAGWGVFVLGEDERGELCGGGGVVWSERRVGEVLAKLVVCVAGGAADADLHQSRSAGGVCGAGAGRARLDRAGGVAESALVAFLGGDAGEHFPWEVVLGADLFVDGEELGGDVVDRHR